MGCASTKESQVGIPSQFRRSQQIQQSVYQPLPTTLYNILRKKNDIQIIRNSKIDQPIFWGELVYKVGELKPNDLKMLCNFKNVLLIDGQEELISLIKNNTSPKCIYAITKQQAIKFISQFPIYSHSQSRAESKLVPILAFSEQQTLRAKRKRLVFLHSQKFNNEQLYKKLKIGAIVRNQGGKDQKIEAIVNKLRKQQTERILFLHAVNTSQETILQILCEFGKVEYGINQLGLRKYFQNILPQTKNADKLIKSQSIIKNQQAQETSLVQIFQKDLKKLHQQMGGEQSLQKLQRSYNLIVNLISNIYNNKQSDNFRRVRKTNKQINESLGKYKYGAKLLEDVGFMDEGGFYVNNIDAKYLKLYRTDLDVAYKKFVSVVSKK